MKWESMKEISKYVPAAIDVEKDGKEHKRKPVDLIDEERLRYGGSTVLGLNDALVELTRALVGLTLSFGNPHLIAMRGFIPVVSRNRYGDPSSSSSDLFQDLILFHHWKFLIACDETSKT